ncbi:MAG TPA: hypothetical protein VEB19_00700 [Gemmatimonadaceae bacterium]|nr:hypothetical protein [Gemmatimonadaceae bacterium]
MRRTTPTEPMDWERPSERFLAYLERLSEACLARDRDQLEKLLRMRLSSHLPRTVLDELEFFRRSKQENLRAPLKTMRYVHQMQQLATAPPDESQLPLELRERELPAPLSTTRRRAPRRSDVPEPRE